MMIPLCVNACVAPSVAGPVARADIMESRDGGSKGCG